MWDYLIDISAGIYSNDQAVQLDSNPLQQAFNYAFLHLCDKW